MAVRLTNLAQVKNVTCEERSRQKNVGIGRDAETMSPISVMNRTNRRHPTGPIVLVSCDAETRAVADGLTTSLCSRGGQVIVLDHQSDASPSTRFDDLIANAEAFLPLFAGGCAVAAWAELEFRAALKAREQRPHLQVIPVVFALGHTPRWLEDWAYLTLPSGLNAASEALLYRACQEAIEPLPLAADCIFQFAEDRVRTLLSEPTRSTKRWVVDPDGTLLSVIDRAFARNGTDSALVAEERIDERDRLVFILNALDRLAPFYFMQAREQMLHYGRDFPKRVLGSIRAFTRITFGQYLVERLTSRADPGKSPFVHEDIRAARCDFERRRAAEPALGFAEFTWALDVDLPKATEWFLDLVLEGIGGREHIRAWMPVYAIGKKDQVALGLSENAAESFYDYDWIDFGMPQVALRVMLDVRRGAQLEQAIERFGWSLSDYGNVAIAQ